MARNEFQISAESVVNERGQLLFKVKVNNGQTEVIKTVSVDSFVKLLENSNKEDGEYVEIPHLPKEVYRAWQHPVDVSSFKAVLVVPAHVGAFLFRGEHFRVPYPTILCKLNCKNGVVGDTKIWTLPTDEPTMETPVMCWPFSNGGDPSGSCCFGSIRKPLLKDVSEAVKVVEAFLDGESNHDLYRGKMSQGELLNLISGRDSFPMEILTKANKTFGDIINN